MSGACLIVTDVQNDFMPGGALAVPRGDEVVPLINRLAAGFENVVLTQDWHPRGQVSFASSHPGKKPFETIRLAYGEQVLWPDHCVQGTLGAAFHPDLSIPHAQLIVRKGYHADVDSYSVFLEADRKTTTGLAGYLRERGLQELCSSAASPPTSASSGAPSMPAPPASTPPSSRTPAVPSTWRAHSQKRGATWPPPASAE